MSGLVVMVCRLVVGGIFVYASLDKLAHPQAFAEAINHYRILPYPLLNGAALLLPMVEFIVGAALILGLARRGAALIAGILTIVFIGAIASAMIQNLDISCGCFNTDGGHGVGLSLLWRDLILLLLCLPPFLLKDGGPELGRLLRK